ncbi:hypothetical protein U1Q18_017027, partial [Sarracenia purpurea var. burkii]
LGSNAGRNCNQDPYRRRSPQPFLERVVFSTFFDSPMGYFQCFRRVGVTPEG